MNTSDFLARVVPGTSGYVTVVWKGARGFAARSYPIANNGFDDAAGMLHWAAHKMNWDAYHALASFKMADIGRDGNFRAERKQTNVQAMKCLIIDCDVARAGSPKSTGKEFANAQAANKWLAGFVQVTGLPLPNLGVRSGSGYHLYWLLEDPLTIGQWQPLADAMKAAMLAHGFPGDTAPTTDGARILRPPGTFNFKTGTAEPVIPLKLTSADYSNDQIISALAPWMGVASATGTHGGATIHALGPKPAGVGGSTKLNQAAHQGTPQSPFSFYAIGKKCAQVGMSLAQGGAGEDYNHWTSNHLLASKCHDGKQAIHDASKSYAGPNGSYDPVACDAKFEQTVNEAVSNNVGAPLCATFNSHRQGVCPSCPHWQKIPSPLRLGNKDDDLPDGYRRADVHGVRRIERMGKENWLPLIVGDFYSPTVEELETGGHRLTVTYMIGATPRVLSVADTEIASNTLGTLLAERGISADNAATNALGSFIVAWIQKLRVNGQVRQGRAHSYGWNRVNGAIVGVAIAGEHYKCDGTVERVPGYDPTVYSMYQAVGTLDEWRKAASLFERPDMPGQQIIIGSGFAAPLVALCSDVQGFTLNLWSPASGVGKTSAIKVGQSIYGSPSLVGSMTDTVNAAMKYMSEPKILPRYWDEFKIQKVNEEDFLQLVYQIPQGREKARMQSNTNLREMGTWQTALVLCCNRALTDILLAHDHSTDAAALRLFEIDLPKQAQSFPIGAGNAISLTEGNYGHAGRIYLQWLATHMDEARRALDHMYKRVVRDCQAQREERFYVTAVATIVCGCVFARNLGLFNFDVKDVYDKLKSSFLAARSLRASRVLINNNGSYDILQVLTQFYNDSANERMRTDRFAGVGRTKISVTTSPKNNILLVHVADKDQVMRVDQKALSDWLHKRNLPIENIFEELKTTYGAVFDRNTLGAGTSYSTGGRTRVIDVPLTGNLSTLI